MLILALSYSNQGTACLMYQCMYHLHLHLHLQYIYAFSRHLYLKLLAEKRITVAFKLQQQQYNVKKQVKDGTWITHKNNRRAEKRPLLATKCVSIGTMTTNCGLPMCNATVVKGNVFTEAACTTESHLQKFLAMLVSHFDIHKAACNECRPRELFSRDAWGREASRKPLFLVGVHL